MSDKKLRVGMVGVGGFGGYRRERMRETGLFELAAVLDRNPEALAQAVAEDHARACATMAELLATPGLEAVVISTGADSHAPLALQALNAGKHVFVEKPLCTSPAEVRELVQAQQQTGLVFGVGHSSHEAECASRLIPELMATGKFGTVACYEANSTHSGGLEIKPGEWRGKAGANPGGMLFQCGVHSLHTLCHLFGPIRSVQAMMRYDVHPATETADVANVLLRHESGMLGTLNCYHVTGYCHELRVFGTKGNVYLDTQQGTALFQERKRGPAEDRVPIAIPAAPPQAACLNLIRWYRAIREGGQPSPALADGINAVLPVFAAEIAAREAREVRLSELLG